MTKTVVEAALEEEMADHLGYDKHAVEGRKVLCSTNAIESLNARYRRAVRARGHFPKGTGQTRWPWLACGRRR